MIIDKINSYSSLQDSLNIKMIQDVIENNMQIPKIFKINKNLVSFKYFDFKDGKLEYSSGIIK